MFHILICDDEPFVCKEIEQALIACGIEKQIDVKVESFASGDKLLAYMGQNQDIDLLFLDIELPGSNGAETGVKIRDELKNEKREIVKVIIMNSRNIILKILTISQGGTSSVQVDTKDILMFLGLLLLNFLIKVLILRTVVESLFALSLFKTGRNK